MKTFFKTFFAVLIANVILLGLLIIMIGAFGASMMAGKKAEIKNGSYLVIDIYGEVYAYDPPETFPLSILEAEPETLHRILGNLEKAAADDRIEGVILKVSSHNNLGMAKIEEIRNAIAKVREKDKMVYAYSDDLSRSSLYLASACDSIFMPPQGNVMYTGYASVVPFAKGTLEKLGVKSEIHQIREYKSAAEMVTRKDMSPEAREMRMWILQDIWEQEMAAVTAERHLTEEQLVANMEHVMFMPHEAKEAKLIDGVLYWDQLKDRLKGDDDELKMVSQADYAKVTRASVGLKGKKKIAVVYAQGMIGGRKSQIDPMFGVVMGHESVASDLKEAAEDENVAAIVFRVDSGGGEGLASDMIGHAAELASKEKPVIVSMIDVAASGGYMISYRATKMVANPTTITGSIGSISGKFNTTGFYSKLGITYDTLSVGPNGLMWSDVTDFTPKQRQIFEENHWRGFNQWLDDVASRRGLTREEAEKLAMGRVWTGRQAKGNGLIDELGGLERAIELAKEAAGIDTAEGVTLVYYPKKKGIVESILGGESPISAMVRWVVYRFFHEDLAETYRLMTTARVNAWPMETTDAVKPAR